MRAAVLAATFLTAGLLVPIACTSRGAPEVEAGFAEALVDSLYRSASIVIVGHVEEIRPGRSVDDGHGETRFEEAYVAAERTLRGTRPPTPIVVEQLAIDGQAVLSELSPLLRSRQDYLLFLRPREGGGFLVLRGGAFRLDGDRVFHVEGGEERLVRDTRPSDLISMLDE
jgi:hypothetical protein